MWDLLVGLGIIACFVVFGALVLLFFASRIDGEYEAQNEDALLDTDPDARLYWLTEKGWADE